MNPQPVYESPAGKIRNGLNIAVVNESQLSYKPFSGGETGGTYEGPDNIIQPLVYSLQSFGYSVEYKRSKSQISTVSFKSAFNVQPNGGGPVNPNLDYIDTWELIRNTTQKELLESDHPLLNQVGENDFRLLKAIFSGSLKISDTADPAFSDTTPADSITASLYLYNLFLSGVKTVPVKQPILRLTRTTSPLYAAPFNVSKVDTILTSATMLTDSGVPTDFAIPLLTLAETLAAKDSDTITRNANQGISLAWGWYKDLVGSNKHGDKRIQYVLQYEFGLWDTALYGNPS